MSKKKQPIEIRFALLYDRDDESYKIFEEALGFFKMDKNYVGKMIFKQGLEEWYKKKIRSE